MPPKLTKGRKPWTVNREATYLTLPPLPAPELIRPVTFCIPDHPDWRAALYGSIALMGSWLAWQRDEGKQGKIVAEIWRGIIQSAVIAAERGEPVECMDWCTILAECIATDGGTQAALNNWLATDTDAANTVTNIIREAQKQGLLTIDQRNANIINPVDCMDGSIFKRVTTLVDLLDSVTKDLFQILKLVSNLAERAEKFIAAVPALGWLPIDEVIGFGAMIVDSLEAAYLAKMTETFRDELRCALFCEFKDGCGFILEEVTAWYIDQAGASLPTGTPMELYEELIQYILTGVVDTGTVVYAMHAFACAIIFTGTEITGIKFSTLALRIEADANELDDDWEILCDECVDPPPVDPDCVDLTEVPGLWQPSLGRSQYYEDEGWGTKTTVDGTFFRVTLPSEAVSRTIGEVRLYLNEAPINPIRVIVNGVNCDFGSGVTDLIINETTFPLAVPYTSGAPSTVTIMVNTSLNITTQTSLRMIMSCLEIV